MARPRNVTSHNNNDDDRMNFIIKILQAKLARKKDSYNALSTKVTYIFSFASVLTAGYTPLVISNQIKFFGLPFIMTLNLIGLIGLFSTLIVLRFAAKTRVFLDPPDLDTIYSDEEFSLKLYDLKNKVAADIRECYERTQRELNQIARWINISLIMLTLSISVIILGSIFQQGYDNISTMSNDNTKPTPKPTPQPVKPSPQPGTPYQNGLGPIKPSNNPGSELPFGESEPTKINR